MPITTTLVYQSPSRVLGENEISQTERRRFFLDTTDAAAAAAAVPYPRGTSGPGGLKVQSAAYREEAPGVWTVDITYNSRILDVPGTNPGDPSIPVKLPIYGEWTRPVRVDNDTRALGEIAFNPNNRVSRRTTAGEFMEPVSSNETWPTVSIAVWSTSAPSINKIPLIGSVNKTTITLLGDIDAPPFCARLAGVKPEQGPGGWWTWYTFQLCYSVPPKGHDAPQGGSASGFITWERNCGYYWKQDGVMVQITDANVPTGVKRDLEEAGDAIASNPIYLDYLHHPIAEFNGLLPPALWENPYP